jgi:two-component system, OmpR family, KDP operon response regulator KdpE
MTHVLAVDDEPDLLRALVLNLTNRGYQVSTAANGRDAIAQATKTPPDLLVLDLGLPDIDGLEVIRQLHSHQPDLPIVVLSARSGSQDKVVALDLGAADYVSKPFDMGELLARLRAAARRSGLAPPVTTVQIGDMRVDLAAKLVLDGQGTPVHFTPTEWAMLDILLRHPGTLITSRQLLTALRGDPEHTESSYLRIYMAQLRRKLEPVPGRPRYLLTEPGMGYRFTP